VICSVDPVGHMCSYFRFWGIAPTDDPVHERAGYNRFKRSFGGQVKEYAGTWDLPSMP
jgi:lipid II:glycine glycyltransferase (peptidoglycan interpeptide bridge formation enzyme)